MSQTNETHRNFISKKAYEIAYALFRVSAVAKKQSLASHLEERGLELLAASASENYGNAKTITAGLDYLLRFGADVGVIGQANAKSIIDELFVLNSAIAELDKSRDNFYATAQEADINGIFSKNQAPEIIYAMSDFMDGSGGIRADSSERSGNSDNGINKEHKTNGNGFIKSEIRQSAIIERIRQNGNCRLKEIQELLPEISERTLRYDIQNLLERGIIERVGNGGPATHYKAKTASV